MMRINNAWRGLICAVVLISLFSACSSSNEETTTLVPNLQELNFGVNESTQFIELGDDAAYQTTGEIPEWITLSVEKTEEINRLNLQVTANQTLATRTASFQVITALETHQIKIVQAKASQQGIYILSEGTWKTNQSDIAYYDQTHDQFYPNYYSKVNGHSLGDVGNDLMIYGSKMYCLVSEQHPGTNDGFIEVIDPKTCKSIQQIPFVVDKTTGKQDIPRRLVFENGKGYITGFSGYVARLDTVSMQLDAVCQLVGDNLKSEGIAIYHDKLYVANSGYGSGNTVSVLDKQSLKELKKIETATNPVNLLTVGDDIYLQTSMTGSPANLFLLNPQTDEIVHTFDIVASKLTVMGDFIYTGTMNWKTYEDEVYKIDRKTKVATPIELDPEEIMSVYSFNVNPATGELYVGSMGDDVVIVNRDGKITKKLNVLVSFISTVLPVAW